MDIDAALAEGFPEPEVENVEEEETAAPVEETVEPEPTEPEEAPAEDLTEKLALLEKRLTDQESFIGRQKSEIGELRSLKEQYETLQQRVDRQPVPPPTSQPEWLDDASMDNPYEARQLVLWAAENQPHQYRAALGAWFDADPASASEFQTEVALAQQKAELEEQYSHLLEVPKRLEAEDATRASSDAFNKAWVDLGTQNPELDEYAAKIIEEAKTSPELASVFQGNDTEAMSRVLNTLFLAAQARRQQASAIAAAETAQTADAAKSKAKVVTATSTAGTRAPVQKSQFNDFLDGAFVEYGKLPAS